MANNKRQGGIDLSMKIPGYRVQSQLGNGGMAKVYLAIQESFDRPVALKVMLPELAANPTFGERFQREAKLCAQMNHPHIVPVYEVGNVDKCHFLSMEYVPGGTLKEKMQKGIRPDEAEQILKEIAGALQHASDLDIIHRDIKPDNIMFRKDGSAVLMDFGIARPTVSSDELTQMGTVVGTPKYMAPEQHRGQGVDPRADIYSLGVVFFEMLTGKPPFTADDPMALGIKHISEPVPLLPVALKKYQPLIRRLLAKSPEKRPQNGNELMALLEQLESGYSNTAEARTQISTDQINDHQPHNAVFESAEQEQIKLEPRLRTQEQKTKTGLLSSHYVFDIYAVADDYPQFQKHAESLTEELKAWGEKRGKKAGALKVKVTVHPWIAGRVKDYFKQLRKADTHTFLKNIPIELTLVGADLKPIEKQLIAAEEAIG